MPKRTPPSSASPQKSARKSAAAPTPAELRTARQAQGTVAARAEPSKLGRKRHSGGR
jgi:hypothetical protein